MKTEYIIMIAGQRVHTTYNLHSHVQKLLYYYAIHGVSAVQELQVSY